VPECRVCKSAVMWDGLCIDCFKYQAIMTAKPVLFVPKTRMVKSRNRTWERDKIMARMLTKDKAPFASTVRKAQGFWIPVYETGDDGMAKIVKVEQARNPFWNVPRAPEGVGSFMVGTLKTKPFKTRREKSDKSGFYDTWEFEFTTKVQLTPNGNMLDITFKIQDMTIGEAINALYPTVPGKATESSVGKVVGVFYDKTTSKGFYDPDMYLGSTVEEVLNDLNTEHLTRMFEIQGGTSEWRFSYTSWTPTLSEYLAKQGVEDLPF
jgi:hypothetical protein